MQCCDMMTTPVFALYSGFRRRCPPGASTGVSTWGFHPRLLTNALSGLEERKHMPGFSPEGAFVNSLGWKLQAVQTGPSSAAILATEIAPAPTVRSVMRWLLRIGLVCLSLLATLAVAPAQT